MTTQASHSQAAPSPLTAPINQVIDDTIAQVMELLHRNDTAEAERIARQLITQKPQNFRIMHLLGMTLHQRSKHREAVYWLTKVARFTKERIETGLALGESLLQLGRYEHALKIYEKMADETPSSVMVQQGIATAHRGLGDMISAVAALRHAIWLDADTSSSYYALGQLQCEVGQPEAAIATYKQLLARKPKDVHVHHLICDATPHKEGVVDGSMQAVMMVLSGKDITDEERIPLYLSLGRAFEAIGDFDRAFENFKRGNQLKRLSIRYAVEQDQEQFATLKKQFTRARFAHARDVALQDDSAIFLVGMPNSGKALAEQILASHPQIHGGGDMEYLQAVCQEPHAAMERYGYPHYVPHLTDEGIQALGLEYLQRRNNRTGKRYITDSTSNNFMFIGMAKLLLPNAKIIHCTRNPLDNCLSAYQRLFPQSHLFSYDLKELGEFYLAYEDLMAFWHAVLPEGSILTVSYEDMVHHTKDTVAKMLAFIGLDNQPQSLDALAAQRAAFAHGAADGSVLAGTSTIEQSIEKWQHYSPYLAQLKQGLGLPCDEEFPTQRPMYKKRTGLASLKAVGETATAYLLRHTPHGGKH